MRNCRIAHRFVAPDESAPTRISLREKGFDVAAARKMLRSGKTVAEIAGAQGLDRQTVTYKLKRLGLGYLITDRERMRALRSGKRNGGS